MADTEPVIDRSVPHSARIWNYFLGGKDHYPVDAKAGDAYLAAFPGIADVAREGRHFLGRAVRYLVQEEGVGQFLDVGTGLPTVDNTHELAQRADPSARIVYVDNDPLVLSHARALLTSTAEGATDFVDADLHEPASILERAWKTLDPGRPVALTLMGVMGHVSDDEEAHALVAELLAGLPPGSFLALYDGHDENAALNEAQQGYDDTGAVPYRLRSKARLEAFFSGLETVEPGIVPCPLWRPEADLGELSESPTLCGVGRKM
ncbi:SAM-dependent methyltransferase [Actinocorallia aurantiaca]|jgi:hypothetical protein|uniref:SAM-dependent methyltransferase n=1 Tax=Actinocorallia aurantiaca TaxID=46204 RepID=A0ABN3U0F8_9ACTN